MTAKLKVKDDGRTVTVKVPISVRKRGGRKLVLAPNDENFSDAPTSRRIDSAIVKAIHTIEQSTAMPTGHTFRRIKQRS